MVDKKWRENVYRMRTEETAYFNSPEWKRLRTSVRKRAKYKCERCGKSSSLAAHHILPREKGGSNALSNLIGLCAPCHEYVHDNIEYLITRNLIAGSVLEDIEIIKEEDIQHYDGEDEYASYRKPWHAWVYGGTRNPRMDQ